MEEQPGLDLSGLATQQSWSETGFKNLDAAFEMGLSFATCPRNPPRVPPCAASTPRAASWTARTTENNGKICIVRRVSVDFGFGSKCFSICEKNASLDTGVKTRWVNSFTQAKVDIGMDSVLVKPVAFEKK